MALLVCYNQALAQEFFWNIIDRFADSVEVIKRDHSRQMTILRINNDELPKEDIEVELMGYSFAGVDPFVIEIKILSDDLSP